MAVVRVVFFVMVLATQALSPLAPMSIEPCDVDVDVCGAVELETGEHDDGAEGLVALVQPPAHCDAPPSRATHESLRPEEPPRATADRPPNV